MHEASFFPRQILLKLCYDLTLHGAKLIYDMFIFFISIFFCFSQASGCTGCRCMHEQALSSAVVIKQSIPPALADDIEDLEIELFYFNGCCKC
jgi:hypothetical protein